MQSDERINRGELAKIVGDLNIHAKEGNRAFAPGLVQYVSDDGRRAGCVEVTPDGSDGWNYGFNIPEDLEVKPGDLVLSGTDGFNHVGFLYVNGRVIRNTSAEDYEREAREWNERWERERRELLEQQRDHWTAVESYLSEPVRNRIQYFREHGEDFELEGWGYEITIGELTDMLVDSNLAETEEIKNSYAYSMCSGNQFGMAKALANAIINGEDVAGTVGGLAPLTGKAYY